MYQSVVKFAFLLSTILITLNPHPKPYCLLIRNVQSYRPGEPTSDGLYAQVALNCRALCALLRRSHI